MLTVLITMALEMQIEMEQHTSGVERAEMGRAPAGIWQVILVNRREWPKPKV